MYDSSEPPAMVFKCLPEEPDFPDKFKSLTQSSAIIELNSAFSGLKTNYNEEKYPIFKKLFEDGGFFNNDNENYKDGGGYFIDNIIMSDDGHPAVSCLHNFFNGVIKIHSSPYGLEDKDYTGLKFIYYIVLNKFMNELVNDKLVRKIDPDGRTIGKTVILDQIKKQIIDTYTTFIYKKKSTL